MRIILLTHYYPPEVGAPQRRLHALARALSDRGAEVTVHTGFPHYPEGGVQRPYRNRLLCRERGEGGRVIRSAVYPAANRGTLRRLADHAAFAASAVATGPAAGASDVVVAESPPLFLAATAPYYARMRGGRLLLHVSDLWPDSAVELGALRSPGAVRAARTLERHAYARADAIVAPTAGIERVLERRQEAAGKVHRIPPGVDVERFAVSPVRREGPLRVIYAGTVGLAHGVGTLVAAARLVGPEVVRVTIAGGGAELPEVKTAASDLAHVRVLQTVTADQVPRLYAEADAAVVLLRDRPVLRGALPTKMFEAMAAARPVVLSGAGESAELIRGADAGLVVPPEDVPTLAASLTQLAAAPEAQLRALGARGLSCARRFDREKMTERWWAVISRLAGPC